MKIINHLITGMAVGVSVTSFMAAWAMALYGEEPSMIMWPIALGCVSAIGAYNEYRIVRLEEKLNS